MGARQRRRNEVLCKTEHRLRVVVEEADRVVALGAEKASDFARLVTVVDGQALW